MATRLNPRQVRVPVTVETLDKSDAWGERFRPARRTRCAFDGSRKLVRDATGTEVVSEASLLLHPTITPSAEVLFTPGSRATLTVGGRERTSRVLSTTSVLHRGRVVYVEVALA